MNLLRKGKVSPGQQEIIVRLDEKLSKLDEILQEAKGLVQDFKEEDTEREGKDD